MLTTRGFTLVEVITALSLLSIGAISLAGLSSGAIRAASISQRRQVAVLLARQKLAEFRSRTLTQTGELRGSFGEPFERYSWQALVEPDGDGRLVNIWLKVSYQANMATSTVTVASTILAGES